MTHHEDSALTIRRLPVSRRWLGTRIPPMQATDPRLIAWGSEWRPLAITISILALCADLPGGEMAAIAVKAPVWLNAIIVIGDVAFAFYCWQWIRYSKHNPHRVAVEGIQVITNGGRWMTVPADTIESVTAAKSPTRGDFDLHDGEIQLSHGGDGNVRITLSTGTYYTDGPHKHPITAVNLRADAPAECIAAWRQARASASESGSVVIAGHSR